jgi:hypothetical protein
MLALVAVCGGGALAGACAGGGGARGAAGEAASWPSAESVEVRPLTRIAVDDGAATLVLHAQVQDGSGLPVRALGRVRVGLYRAEEGEGERAAAWDVDLREPGVNGEAYDALITRSYTLRLAGLPAWAAEWARGGAGEAPAVRVEMELVDGRRLEATSRVGRGGG